MLYINILRDLAAVYIAFDQFSSLAYALAKLAANQIADLIIQQAVTMMAHQPEVLHQPEMLSFASRWFSP